MAKVQDELMKHNYDGIQEYDNDLPGWWKNLFLLTIVFAVIYFFYFHVMDMGNSQEEKYLRSIGALVEDSGKTGSFSVYHSPYANAMGEMTPAARAEIARLQNMPFNEQLKLAMSKADAEQLAKLEAAFPEIVEEYRSGGTMTEKSAATAEIEAVEAVTEPLTDDASLAAGKQIFETQCFACHGKLGEGGIGPNMTDEYWIHGGSYSEIINTIKVGVPAKGMIPWLGTLKIQQIEEVASYILTLQGSHPPNAKAPEGEKSVGS